MTNETVKLIECPRDAWQGLPRQIPTERKAEYLRALVAAGFLHLDAASFVSPKAVPQMADSEQALAQLGAAGGVEIIGIDVTEKGAEGPIPTGAGAPLGGGRGRTPRRRVGSPGRRTSRRRWRPGRLVRGGRDRRGPAARRPGLPVPRYRGRAAGCGPDRRGRRQVPPGSSSPGRLWRARCSPTPVPDPRT